MNTIEIAEVEDMQKEHISTMYGGVAIYMRKSDGFIDAIDMQRVNADKRWDDYIIQAENKRYFDAVVRFEKYGVHDTGTPIVVENCIHNGIIVHRWVNHKLAVHFATWIDPEFGIWMIDWIERVAGCHNDKSVQTDEDKEQTYNELKAEVAIHKDTIKTLEDYINDSECDINNLCNLNDNLAEELETEINDYKYTIENLETEINKLKNDLEDQHPSTMDSCPYCDYKFPSTDSKSHLGSCVHNNGSKFRAIIDHSNFDVYINMFNSGLDRNRNVNLKITGYGHGLSRTLLVDKNRKEYAFDIFLNESRWKVIKFLEDDIVFPLEHLLDSNSLAMFRANKDICGYLHKLDSHDAAYEYELMEYLKKEEETKRRGWYEE